jgi:hydroxymethylpyrimidine/phosphomethylpyrimidine kinase
LSAAITAFLARGMSLPDAVDGGLEFVNRAIAHHYRWTTPRQVDALGV